MLLTHFPSEDMVQFPLISVVVLTYNSSKYVLSTLESIKRQTFTGDLELIIGDDCSSDNTVEICKRWLEGNKTRFASVQILVPPENQGTVANLNSCVKAATGLWIKAIGGDDILKDDALVLLYGAVTNGLDKYHFVSSDMYSFVNDEEIEYPEKLQLRKIGKSDTPLTLYDAFKNPCFWITPPTFFYSKEMMEKIGYCPTMFRNIEDRPLAAKVLSCGYAICRLAKPTVFYRINPTSVSATTSRYRFTECDWKVYYEILRPMFGILRQIDMDLRMLPMWYLTKRRKKTLDTKIFKLCCKMMWATYRALTFFLTMKRTGLKK